jgi:hypothetical protein
VGIGERDQDGVGRLEGGKGETLGQLEARPRERALESVGTRARIARERQTRPGQRLGSAVGHTNVR